MKLLNKLALATAVAALSTASFAMEAMTDDSMAATTGQDGITLRIDTAAGLTAQNIFIHDNDGGAASGDAGAITINGLSITDLGLTANIDADGNGGTPILEVGVVLDALELNIDSIGVAQSVGQDAPATGNVRGIVAGTDATILSNLNVKLGALTANLQLGNEAANTSLASISSTITDGIELTVSVNDNDGGSTGAAGTLDLGTINITDSGSNDLDVTANIDIDGNNGLEIESISTGTQQVYISDFGFNGTAIGDIEIVGLNTGNTTISVAGR